MKGKCYLCGKDADTGDHIPPRGFFPKPRPSNLIKVPCCRSCNEAFSPEDDYFRMVLSSGLNRSATGDYIWENKVLPNTVKRLPTEVDKILESCEDALIETASGPMDVVRFKIDPHRVNRYMVRLTKGLLRHYFPDYDYSQSRFDVEKVGPQRLEQLDSIEHLLRLEERGDAVFSTHHRCADITWTRNFCFWRDTASA